jgi:putative ABC transport system ATP-binding protein
VKPIIEASNVWKFYEQGKVLAVKGASLAVYPGEMLAIVGPSGSGKTTLLAMLGAMLSPTRGVIRLGGRSLSSLSEGERTQVRRWQIGFVFQTFNLFPALTALENVEVALQLQGRRDGRHRALSVLESVGIGHRVHFYPRDLSGGEQQRVAIARALVHEPRIILADEPTGSLDSRTGLAVARLLTERAREFKSAVVIVTHDFRLRPLMDRILVMEDGRLGEIRGGATPFSEEWFQHGPRD